MKGHTLRDDTFYSKRLLLRYWSSRCILRSAVEDVDGVGMTKRAFSGSNSLFKNGITKWEPCLQTGVGVVKSCEYGTEEDIGV